MANNLTEAIPRILAQGLMALREYCVMPRLVNTDYAAEAKQKGDTIDIPIPSAVTVQDVAPANVMPNFADMAITKAQIPLTYWREAGFYLTDADIAKAMNGIVPLQSSEAIRALANDVNAKLFALYTKIPAHVGAAGTTPFSGATPTVNVATDARRALNIGLAPTADRRMVLDPDAEAAALALPNFQAAYWRGDDAGINEGELGRKFGMDWYSDQVIPTHTAGTLSNGTAHKALVNHAADGGFLLVGNTTCDIDATTLTGTVVIGDVFQVAGDPNWYTITAGATAAANAIAGMAFSPANKVQWANNAEITFADSHVVNLAFHRDCFALAVRTLEDGAVTAADREAMMTAVDPVSQLALRLEVRRENKRVRWAYDILYGVGVVRPSFGCRVMG